MYVTQLIAINIDINHAQCYYSDKNCSIGINSNKPLNSWHVESQSGAAVTPWKTKASIAEIAYKPARTCLFNTGYRIKSCRWPSTTFCTADYVGYKCAMLTHLYAWLSNIAFSVLILPSLRRANDIQVGPLRPVQIYLQQS